MKLISAYDLDTLQGNNINEDLSLKLGSQNITECAFVHSILK